MRSRGNPFLKPISILGAAPLPHSDGFLLRFLSIRGGAVRARRTLSSPSLRLLLIAALAVCVGRGGAGWRPLGRRARPPPRRGGRDTRRILG
ncbi:hypothetical protein EYF80_040426 [Liparis tanakae]|uniref:Uncharacterized protein n=1 Tax=Liparis tanakae TaxID=230148 RepID=A0A4Z2G8G0_9TELE|nr:hypothetical protein EYF80_040426 [Liparis tanakae]